MAKPVNVAVVGLGSIAQRGILPHLAMDDCKDKLKFQRFCDNVPGRAESLAKQYGAAKWGQDYAEVLADPEVEAVLLATPIGLHYQQSMDALKAGKHVYVQKTMTMTKKEADEVIAEAEKRKLTAAASPGQIFSPSLQRMRALVNEGAVGVPFWGFNPTLWEGHTTEDWRGSAGANSNVDLSWYYRPGGGPLYDVAVYALHNLTSVFGPVKKVSALGGIRVPQRQWQGKSIDVTTPDNVVINMEFASGALGLTSGQMCPWGTTMSGQLCFFGSTGVIEATGSYDGSAWPKSFLLNGKDFDPLKGWTPPIEDGLRLLTEAHAKVEENHGFVDILHFLGCIRSGKQPVNGLYQARHVVEVIDLAYQSVQGGKTLETQSSFSLP